jgi:hypothetical protein
VADLLCQRFQHSKEHRGLLPIFCRYADIGGRNHHVVGETTPWPLKKSSDSVIRLSFAYNEIIK